MHCCLLRLWNISRKYQGFACSVQKTGCSPGHKWPQNSLAMWNLRVSSPYPFWFSQHDLWWQETTLICCFSWGTVFMIWRLQWDPSLRNFQLSPTWKLLFKVRKPIHVSIALVKPKCNSHWASEISTPFKRARHLELLGKALDKAKLNIVIKLWFDVIIPHEVNKYCYFHPTQSFKRN